MWVYKSPKEGDTVQVEFSEWTKLGIRVGVFLRYANNRHIVDFGDTIRWLTTDTDYLVWEN